MQKIPTLFLRNPENMKLVTREVNPEATWVFAVDALPTVKKDGTNVRVTVHDGKGIYLEKRRNPTREEKATGAEPSYVNTDPADTQDKHIYAAFDATDFSTWPTGTWPCEALGPKIQGGIESSVPCLYPFSMNGRVEKIRESFDLSYDGIRAYLERHEIEGIVWYENGTENGRMCKIKRRDFGLAWPVKR